MNGNVGSSMDAVDIDRMFPAYDLQEYGGVGDGATDNTAALTAAISALNTAGGGTLLARPGTYKHGNIAIPYNNIRIIGDNAKTAVFLHTGTGIAWDLGALTNVTIADLGMENITLQNGANTTWLLRLGGVQLSTFNKVRLLGGAVANGLELRRNPTVGSGGLGSFYNVFRDCYIYNTLTALQLKDYNFVSASPPTTGVNANDFNNCRINVYSVNGVNIDHASGNAFIGGSVENGTGGRCFDVLAGRALQVLGTWLESPSGVGAVRFQAEGAEVDAQAHVVWLPRNSSNTSDFAGIGGGSFYRPAVEPSANQMILSSGVWSPHASTRVDINGYIHTRVNSAPADAAVFNGDVTFWLDQTPGATKMMFKAKDSGGTVRTGSVNLT